MTFRGVIKGRTITVDTQLPFPTGAEVDVSIEPANCPLELGSPELVLRAVLGPPHVDPVDVEAMEAAIREGKIRVRSKDIFADDV